MIKGVDTQIMIQRTADYSKDVSTMLRKDELANEFADRMNKLNAQQEIKTVSHLGKAEHAQVHGDQEKEEKHQEQRHKQEDKTVDHDTAAEMLELAELPMGEEMENRLLDIEI